MSLVEVLHYLSNYMQLMIQNFIFQRMTKVLLVSTQQLPMMKVVK